MPTRPTRRIYDTEKTAELFCHIVNRWQAASGEYPWLAQIGRRLRQSSGSFIDAATQLQPGVTLARQHGFHAALPGG